MKRTDIRERWFSTKGRRKWPALTNAIVRCGSGRGFIIAGHKTCYIVTSTHCLPRLPSSRDDALLHGLFASPSVPANLLARCIFADVIAGVAVIGPTNHAVWPAMAAAFDHMTRCAIGMKRPSEVGNGHTAWISMPNGAWRATVVDVIDDAYWLRDPPQPFDPTMLGSPIVSGEGVPVGILTTVDVAGGPQPWLAGTFPNWLLAKMAVH